MWQREALGKKCKEVASNLGVDSATVSRITARFRETGLVLKKSHPSRRAFRKLTVGIKMTILHTVLRRPGVYLHEIERERELSEMTGAVSTICMFLMKCGFTRQKLRISAIQRDSFLRLQFASEVSLYDRDMMIFLDETGSDRRKREVASLREKTICHSLHSSQCGILDNCSIHHMEETVRMIQQDGAIVHLLLPYVFPRF